MTFKLSDFFPKPAFNEPLLALNDPRWGDLEGGYQGTKYDASVTLRQLEGARTLAAVDTIYKELWNDLHHQGDVGLASYYAVPHLVRIAKQNQLVDSNVLGLVSTIEIQRHKNNPKLPAALKSEYMAAVEDLAELVKMILNLEWNTGLSGCALAALAVAKNQAKLADVIINLDDDVIDEFLENY